MNLKHSFDKYFKLNLWIVLGIITIIYFVALTIEFRFIFTDEFYYKSFENKNTFEKIQSFINADRHSEWLNYPYAFFRILIPSFLIAGLLYIGKIIHELKVRFSELFAVALRAQIIFALNYFLAVLLKWGELVDKNWGSVNNNYHYQSLLVFFRGTNLPYWLYYPLQSINITEILHIIFLAAGIHVITPLKYKKSLGFILTFYGIGLLIWIIFTVFLQTIIKV